MTDATGTEATAPLEEAIRDRWPRWLALAERHAELAPGVRIEPRDLVAAALVRCRAWEATDAAPLLRRVPATIRQVAARERARLATARPFGRARVAAAARGAQRAALLETRREITRRLDRLARH
ncbi:MAG: hypothetical protein JNL90_03770 [Planctomycetes bacterium]|nr:hypothetical protein [Planctomycetota bacterium]